MRSLRGKVSNLAVISKFFNANGSAFPILCRFQLFDSMDGNGDNGQFRKYGNHGFDGRKNDDYDDVDNDRKFSERNRENFSAQKSFRSSRGDRQMPQFQGKPNFSDRSDRRQGRNDGFKKPFGGDRNKADMKLDDEFFKFDGIDESTGGIGLGGDNGGKKTSQPSVNELLNKPVSSEQSSKKEGSDFLDKFKLGSVDNTESKPDEPAAALLPQEEMMEEPGDADEIFKKMKQTGLIPNAVAMLDGLCRDGLVREAMKLFDLMREKGSIPEVVVYTAVVEGFCQAQNFDDAKRIFRKMQNNGIVPNAFSYTILIRGLSKAKRVDDAADFCVEMLENGHSPNVITFIGLVQEFCKEKGVKEAQSIVVTLKQRGYLLDEKVVKAYLDKDGPKSSMVWEAIFGPKNKTQRQI